jgi:antitoxin HigA-1
VIRSFADKRKAALFAGYSVRRIPNEIQRRARAKLFTVDAAGRIDDLRIPPGNRPEALFGERHGSTASASMINGGYASNGAKAPPGTSGSSITTRDDAMSIKREDLDAGRVDLAEVTTGRRLPPVHPGEILRADFLKPMKLSVYTLAQAIKVPRSRLNDIALARRGITADTAFRLARYFGTSPEFWINLQARYDLDMVSARRVSSQHSGARNS